MTDSKLIKKCEDVLMREGYTEIGEVLSKLLTRFKALSTGKGENRMISSQAYVKELEQYGITDDMGYINRAMQNYAQQFIDDHIKSIQEFKDTQPAPVSVEDVIQTINDIYEKGDFFIFPADLEPCLNKNKIRAAFTKLLEK